MDKKIFTGINNHFLKVIAVSEEFKTEKVSVAIRNENLLYPPFKEALNKAIAMFNEKYPRVEVFCTETFRSNGRQMKLKADGFTKISTMGMHYFGIAADFGFKIDLDGDGKKEFTYKGDFDYLRSCFVSCGLTILGSWDIGHVQFIPVNEQNNLRGENSLAIKKFQASVGLLADGIIGDKTIKALKESLETPEEENKTSPEAGSDEEPKDNATDEANEDLEKIKKEAEFKEAFILKFNEKSGLTPEDPRYENAFNETYAKALDLFNQGKTLDEIVALWEEMNPEKEDEKTE